MTGHSLNIEKASKDCPWNGWGPRLLLVGCLLAVRPGWAAPDAVSASLARQLVILASDAAPLIIDPSLEKAAHAHAKAVLGSADSAQREQVKAALAREGLADAQFWPFTGMGDDPEALQQAARDFAKTVARPRGATHLGVAWAQKGVQTVLVVLFVRRLVELAPLAFDPQRGARLRGWRPQGPVRAWLFGPCEQLASCRRGVTALSVRRQGQRLQVDIPPLNGRAVVELEVETAAGPELTALWRLGPPEGPKALAQDLPDWVAALRTSLDLAPLTPHDALNRAAAAHAQAVCRLGRAVHLLEGQTPQTRAQKAGFDGRATENVAIAGSLHEAHFNLITSPSHRRNLVDPMAHFWGYAVVPRPAEAGVGESVCVVQLFGRD